MADKSLIEERLREAGISATPVRILVFRCLLESDVPLSLIEIEEKLETVERSTVSRTLNTFRNKHLIHSINDGSGSVKHEICHAEHHSVADLHVHFRCNKCGKTICLHEMAIPRVKLPEGYLEESAEYIISGTCNKCSAR